MKEAFATLKTRRALGPDLLCKEYLIHMHEYFFSWTARAFAPRFVSESTVRYTFLDARKVVMARELAKLGKLDLQNTRLIAQYTFFEKWYQKCVEQHLQAKVSYLIDDRIGGIRRGSRILDFVSYVNTAIQHSHTWQLSLTTAKVDVRRMFANVPYSVLHATLMSFDIPMQWINILMAQVACNRFEITTVRGDVVCVDLQQGLIEGAAVSIMLIGLLLTRFLQQLRSEDEYKQCSVTLPFDEFQPPITLKEAGWIDDWVLFADSVQNMERLLHLWSRVLQQIGWSIHVRKIEFLCTSQCPQHLCFEDNNIAPCGSFVWLGCKILNTGRATAHVHHRTTLATASWRLLIRHFDFTRLPFRVNARLYKSIIEAVLTHGCNSFALTADDFDHVRKFQNMVQRTFIRSAEPDQRARWLEIHSRLNGPRTLGYISDSISVLVSKCKRSSYCQVTQELIDFRGSSWLQALGRRRPDRKRCGRPAITLASLLK